jgi:hypothetical protein
MKALMVYPSIEELIPKSMQAVLPQSLAEEITERYETLGEKYLTEQMLPDGRHINGMIFTDRMVNCREEVVDAVFCVLGQAFKDVHHGHTEPSENLGAMLDGLVRIYSLCVQMEQQQNYTNVSP